MARVLGRVRKVDVVVYKADRLGDWLLAEPAIVRIVSATQAGGGSAVLWAADESRAFRDWRPPTAKVQAFALEPRGLVAKIFRAVAVIRLLAVYRTRSFICLRHTPEPVRDFILANVAADEIYALSRCLISGSAGAIPNEFHRHFAILKNSGFPVDDARALLPNLPRCQGPKTRRVVLAPFSSAMIKDWPDQSWGALIPTLADRGFQFEIWVGSSQIRRSEALARQVREQAPAVNIVTKSGGLVDLAEAVDSAALVLTVDTFTAHLGIAMDAPTVCLVGGGLYGDFGPWHKTLKQKWVANLLPCFGCNWICSRPSIECIEDISPSVVLEAIESVLSEAT